MKRFLPFFILMLVLVSACSPAEGDNRSGEEDGELIIRENNTVFRFVAEDSQSLLPVADISYSAAEVMQMVYEPLFDFDESLNAIPVLAESCTPSSGATQYRVSLKTGVTWHDGSEFNANDVIYTINALKNGQSIFSGDVKKIKQVDIINKNKILITLNEPTPNAAGLLGFPIIKRNTPLEPDGDFVPVGTGPYRFSEKKNNTYYFVRNENWQNGEASDKTITLTLLKDKKSAVYAFEANEADVISSDLMDLTQNTPRGRVTMHNYLSNKLTFLGLNNAEGILSDPEIRRAVSYLIDKNTIIKQNLYGRGAAVEVPVYPNAWFYDDGSDLVEVMVESNYLETLLNENEWYLKNGVYSKDFDSYEAELTLSILVNRDSREKMAIAQSIAQVLGENGIVIKIKAVPYEQYNGRIRSRDFSMFIGEIAMDKNMDPAKLVKTGENYFAYQSEDMDTILAQMGSAQSNEEIIACYSNFSALFLQDMPFIPLFFREEALIASSELTGFGMPNYYKTYRNIENWYFSQKVELNRP